MRLDQYELAARLLAASVGVRGLPAGLLNQHGTNTLAFALTAQERSSAPAWP